MSHSLPAPSAESSNRLRRDLQAGRTLIGL